MKQHVKNLISKFFSWWCLKGVRHGKKVRCNFKCKFSKNTEIGDNCHFNGCFISGSGKVVFGNNFHSGKHIRIITTYHNFDKGDALPYDNTSYSKDVIIDENVWLGESVLILGGGTYWRRCGHTSGKCCV